MADYLTNKKIISEALLNMINLKENMGNAWIIVTDADSDAFVQFRNELNNQIFLDFPLVSLTDLEINRAEKLFKSLGVFAPEKIVLVDNENDNKKIVSIMKSMGMKSMGTTLYKEIKPYLIDIDYSLLEVYKYDFGSECDKAAEFALKILNDVFLLGKNINLAIEKGWEL